MTYRFSMSINELLRKHVVVERLGHQEVPRYFFSYVFDLSPQRWVIAVMG